MTEADTLLLQAQAALARREIADAISLFHAAEVSGAESDICSNGRWMAAVMAGNFAAAWQESDQIRERGAHDPYRFWNGEDLTGKRVIVRCLHGFGDAVQMFRYAPLLAQRAAEVIYEVPPRMVPLALCFRGVHTVITWGEDAPAVPPLWDVQMEIMELPYIFRTQADHLPLTEVYLDVPKSVSEEVATVMGRAQRPRVGMVWTGGEWNLDRSVPFTMLAPLLTLGSVEFWNLQGGPARAEADRTSMLDAGDNSLLALAATIGNLDLVITTDTLAAHLAGAMGKPVWVMLQQAADWRWMIDRDDSPWYRTMRLFRQPVAGDWSGVVSEIFAALIACYGTG